MIVQIAVIMLVVSAAALVVFTRNPRRQIFAFAYFGLALSLLFLVDEAPDVALSEIAVGAAAVPLAVLVTLARMERK